jgi:hypothetical protein
VECSTPESPREIVLSKYHWGERLCDDVVAGSPNRNCVAEPKSSRGPCTCIFVRRCGILAALYNQNSIEKRETAETSKPAFDHETR